MIGKMIGAVLVLIASGVATAAEARECREVRVCSERYSRSHSVALGGASGVSASSLWKREAKGRIKDAIRDRFPRASIDGSLSCPVKRRSGERKCWMKGFKRKCRVSGRACMEITICGRSIRGGCEPEPIRLRRDRESSNSNRRSRDGVTQCVAYGPFEKRSGWESRVVRKWERKYDRRWASHSDRSMRCRRADDGRHNCTICATR